jgi:hypothetical protein
MLFEIFQQDRWMRIAHLKLKNSAFYNPEIVKEIDFFLSGYAISHNLSVKEIINIYNNFTAVYSVHIREFLKTAKYPYEYTSVPVMDRIEYDVVLMLSIVLSVHRHRIFNNLMEVSRNIDGEITLIGIGSGLEMAFLNNHDNITAYDISISDHVKAKYKNIKLVESYFSGSDGDCSHVFAIELLEHISEPMALIKTIYDSLRSGGYFYFTTATDIPQIDHLYNFNDSNKFESDLREMGFTIVHNDRIEHESFDAKLKARNNWYTLKK